MKKSAIKEIYYSPKVVKFTGRAQGEFKLINPGDRVLVALSGGKDSYVLAAVLKRMQLIAPFEFELKAITIDPGVGIDYSPIKRWCEKIELEYEIYSTPIFDIMKEKKRVGSSACGFCARMRRGALYSKAKEYGFNKLALGHHFDDAVETFFMSMFYNGMMKSMPPKYRAYNGIEVIRPLIKVREKWIEFMAEKNNFEIIDSKNSCLALKDEDENAKNPYVREKIKRLLRALEKKEPKIFQRFESAFYNIECDSFFMQG